MTEKTGALSYVAWTDDLLLLQISRVVLFGNQGSQSVRQHVSVESSSLPIHSIKPYLFVYHDESLTS